MALLELLLVEQLDDHPENPRVVIREEIVDGIAANLNGEWPQQHAFHVRPLGDRFQILAGHTRKRAAIKAGIDRVWCWIDEMDDDSAFMQLVTSNNQGELDPLEIGIHAYRAVPIAKGGRGKKGGLSEYAKRIGRSAPSVTQMRNAGEIVESLKRLSQLNGFLGKTQHLNEIHRLPKWCWQACCEWLADSTASVVEVRRKVPKQRLR